MLKQAARLKLKKRYMKTSLHRTCSIMGPFPVDFRKIRKQFRGFWKIGNAIRLMIYN